MMKKRIQIIGGGVGGLSAAYALTATQNRRDLNDVTVYQMGWRLGGKCATGRGKKDRIEEHGIHGFIGSYYNTLLMLKDVFSAWGKPDSHPLSTFEKALIGTTESFAWETSGKALSKWSKALPHSPIAIEQSALFDTFAQWIGMYSLQLQMLTEKYPALSPLLECESDPTQIKDDIDWTIINAFVSMDLSFKPSGKSAKKRAKQIETEAARRDRTQLQFLQVMLRGVRDDEVATRGFYPLDGEDFDAWLERHGADEEILRFPIVTTTINLAFQYPDGDLTKKPVMSACSYVQWVLRMMLYVDSPYFMFTAGTGESMITPLYEVLKARGVKFKFFHEMKNVTLSKDGKTVKAIEMLEQTQTKGEAEYQPLVNVGGVGSWPAKPLYSQLAMGEFVNDIDFEAPGAADHLGPTVLMKKGEDFDHIILATPPAAIPHSANALCERHANFQIASEMETTATQAMQLWLKDDIETLTEFRDHDFLSGNYRSGFHGHADFSKYIEFESWGKNGPKSLVYFCGVMTDPKPIEGVLPRTLADFKAKCNAESMLLSVGHEIFPGRTLQNKDWTACPYSFDFDALYVPKKHESKTGVKRLKHQYVRGNVLPSERYTQSPPGTKAKRISPLDTGISNLSCAGDWVDTGLNVGSVEGTVMGGFLAACGVDKSISPDDIIALWPTQADKDFYLGVSSQSLSDAA